MTTTDIYMLDDAGKLFRKGEEIGKLEGEALTLKPEARNYQAAVTRWLREKADEAESTPAPKEEVKVKLTPAQQEAADNAGISREAQEEAAVARDRWRDDMAFSKRTGCPPPPKKNPQFGDKSPAFVEWLHKYRPDEFSRRFGVTGKGKVPVIETNPVTGIDEVTGYREAYFARCKTHLTEVETANRGLGEDMDWNA